MRGLLHLGHHGNSDLPGDPVEENRISGVIEYPPKWGFLIPYQGRPLTLKDVDVEALEWMREHFKERYEDEPIPIKGVLKETASPFVRKTSILPHLLRLWANGRIERFAKGFHTLSGRPNYGSYFIWHSWAGDHIADNDLRGPAYFMP